MGDAAHSKGWSILARRSTLLSMVEPVELVGTSVGAGDALRWRFGWGSSVQSLVLLVTSSAESVPAEVEAWVRIVT